MLPNRITPAPPPVEAHEPEGAPVHVVQPNDNLWRISEQYYGNGQWYERIIAANRLSNDILRVGMRLVVPGGRHPGEDATEGRRAADGTEQ